jgi:hypothetical protein
MWYCCTSKKSVATAPKTGATASKKRKDDSVPPYYSEPLFPNSTFEEAILRELAENDITTEERTKDYLASQRRKKEEEFQR